MLYQIEELKMEVDKESRSKQENIRAKKLLEEQFNELEIEVEDSKYVRK